jgi:hypothetical protein
MDILKRFARTDSKILLGRWGLNDCNKRINKKIDLSNEDHCGPCGQYDQVLEYRGISKENTKKEELDKISPNKT